MNTVIEQIKSFLEEPDMTAALANLSSLLKETYPDTNWTGFYYVKNNELILGPFQGRPACTHIPFSKGVCGAAYRTSQVQLVPDVTAIADHIACDSASRSELCVPVLVNGECVLLIDMDAPTIAYFTEEMAAEQKEAAKEIASAWIAHRWPN